MSDKNNVVHLNDRKGLNMEGNSPIFYTVSQLIEKYPTIKERGWTADDFELWVSQDIITGKHQDETPGLLEIEIESFEDFLEYHNNHLLKRAERVQKNIDSQKKRPAGK